ncbi:MAG: GAF domain-containing protein, partial [Methylicorpusculum sp.]|nr:GAF domain-containing protein [Methylicorpusculum sp.]
MTNYSQQDIEQALLNCEAEPIHQIGQIQPHGVLLVISDSSPRRILQCSANLGHFLGLSFESIQNLLLEDVLGISSALLVEQLILETKENQAATCLLSLRINEQQRELQVRLFMSANLYVLEFMDEDALNSQDRLPEFFKLIKKGLSIFEQDIDIYDYFNRIAVLIRDLTGFNRVMVYRFDINWDGEVIAESRVEEAESYLGLHFPASDIPPQARHLYTLNYIRHIADTSAEPVPVLPVLNPLTGQPLDMSFSSLRCFSPVHREYLRNMGVQASLSISLLQNGRLWGLIACHHLTPRRVSNALEEAATLIGRMASVKLFAIEADNQRKLINKSSHIMGELLKHITVNTEEVIISQLLTELLDLMKATGVMMKTEGKLYTQGEVPSAPIIDDLFTWLDKGFEVNGTKTY